MNVYLKPLFEDFGIVEHTQTIELSSTSHDSLIFTCFCD